MIELAGAFEAGKAGLGLVAEAVTLAKELSARSKGDATLADLLGKLRSRSVELAHFAEQGLVELRKDLEDAKIDPSRTIESLLRETKWYQWLIRSRLREARDRFRAIEDHLRGLIEDVSTLLLCSGRIYETGGAFADARKEKIDLMNSISTQIPIKDLLGKLSELATRLSKQAM